MDSDNSVDVCIVGEKGDEINMVEDEKVGDYVHDADEVA